MEKGLNPKGYLVCKFAFKVSASEFTAASSVLVSMLYLAPP
jgi:hypothetical protein